MELFFITTPPLSHPIRIKHNVNDFDGASSLSWCCCSECLANKNFLDCLYDSIIFSSSDIFDSRTKPWELFGFLIFVYLKMKFIMLSLFFRWTFKAFQFFLLISWPWFPLIIIIFLFFPHPLSFSVSAFCLACRIFKLKAVDCCCHCCRWWCHYT